VWTLVALAGARLWTLIPTSALLVAAAWSARPRIVVRGSRALDVALLAALAAIALQLVPLPPALHNFLSPHADAVARAIFFEVPAGWRPLSLDTAGTTIALFVDVLALAAFWSLRDALDRDGMRTLVRMILGAGLVVCAAAIVGAAATASGSRFVYGVFEPTDPVARPYGPFVNRNEMATWVLLALPVAIGYCAARIRRRSDRGAEIVDATTVWLVGGCGVMVAALVLSLSRSGIIAAAAEGVCGIVLALSAAERRRHAAIATAGIAAAAIAIALAMPRTSELVGRFDRTLTVKGADGRTAIWRDTRTMIRDFPLTGVGAGAYPTGMLVYQQGSRLFFNNHAHDQYLQILAEGGALVAIPLGFAAMAFGVAVVRRLRAERSANYWMRAGAVTGIMGALLQSVWELGLAAPANALLFAAVCAIAVRNPTRRPDGETTSARP
jgi:O-antigen ligase